MVLPYSTYQLVAVPFGLTLPVMVAVVGPTAVTGPVVALGFAPAAGATETISAAVAMAKRARITVQWYPGSVRQLSRKRKDC